MPLIRGPFSSQATGFEPSNHAGIREQDAVPWGIGHAGHSHGARLGLGRVVLRDDEGAGGRSPARFAIAEGDLPGRRVHEVVRVRPARGSEVVDSVPPVPGIAFEREQEKRLFDDGPPGQRESLFGLPSAEPGKLGLYREAPGSPCGWRFIGKHQERRTLGRHGAERQARDHSLAQRQVKADDFSRARRAIDRGTGVDGPGLPPRDRLDRRDSVQQDAFGSRRLLEGPFHQPASHVVERLGHQADRLRRPPP